MTDAAAPAAAPETPAPAAPAQPAPQGGVSREDARERVLERLRPKLDAEARHQPETPVSDEPDTGPTLDTDEGSEESEDALGLDEEDAGEEQPEEGEGEEGEEQKETKSQRDRRKLIEKGAREAEERLTAEFAKERETLTTAAREAVAEFQKAQRDFDEVYLTALEYQEENALLREYLQGHGVQVDEWRFQAFKKDQEIRRLQFQTTSQEADQKAQEEAAKAARQKAATAYLEQVAKDHGVNPIQLRARANEVALLIKAGMSPPRDLMDIARELKAGGPPPDKPRRKASDVLQNASPPATRGRGGGPAPVDGRRLKGREGVLARMKAHKMGQGA